MSSVSGLVGFWNTAGSLHGSSHPFLGSFGSGFKRICNQNRFCILNGVCDLVCALLHIILNPLNLFYCRLLSVFVLDV